MNTNSSITIPKEQAACWEKYLKIKAFFLFIANITFCKSYAIILFRFLTELGKVQYIFT